MKFPFLCLIMPAAMLSFAGEPAAVSLQDRPGCIEISIDAGRDCQAGDIALYIDNDDWRPSGWRGPDNDWQCGADLQIRNGVARWWWGETLESGDWGNGMELPVRFDGRILTITVPDDRYLLKRETTVRAVAMIGAESVPADPGRETLSWEIAPPPFPEIKAPVPVPPPGRPEPPGEPLTRREFRGFYADEPEGRDGLRNPERGLRTMTYCGELPAPGQPQPRPAELGWLTRYPQTTLLQAYCWLTDYYDRPLPESKLAALRRDLAASAPPASNCCCGSLMNARTWNTAPAPTRRTSCSICGNCGKWWRITPTSSMSCRPVSSARTANGILPRRAWTRTTPPNGGSSPRSAPNCYRRTG